METGYNSDNKIISSYLSFRLDNELFAVNVHQVINILELTKITEVPKAPYYMKGVINLRGKVLPVIDTRLKFGMEAITFTKNTCIVVMEININGERIELGSLVDSVLEVIEVSAEAITPPPSLGNKYKSNFITGMLKQNDDFIMMLDIDNVFSTDDIIDFKESSEEAPLAEEESEQNINS
jgi:purine-binding chemotaxis protein CheW